MNKKFIISSLLGVMASCQFTVAENYLQVVPATLAVGNPGTLELKITSSEPWSAFQMVLELPSGLTLGEMTLGANAQTTHLFDKQAVEASHTGYTGYCLVGYASDNQQFKANEGIVLNLSITANTLTEGVYSVYAKSLILDNGEADNEGDEVVSQSSYITVGAPVAKNIELEGAVPGFVASAIAAEQNALVFAETNIEGVDHNVVVGGNCDNFVLGSSYTNEKSFSAANASYTRSVSTLWGTLCIPYVVRSNSDVQLYQLSGSEVSGSEATYIFSPVTSAEAGKPVVFKKLDENAIEVSFTTTSTEVSSASDLQTVAPASGWTMLGAYTQQVMNVTEGELAAQSVYYFSSDIFYLATGQLTVPAYRGWFETAKTQGAPVRYFIGEGEAEGITIVEQENGDVLMHFDLMGRPAQNQHGLQIMGGQKALRINR